LRKLTIVFWSWLPLTSRLRPAELFGALVVPPEEGFNGLAQLIFGFEASSVERLALQQTERDFNLVQPTG
jgi:hypothetical protein